MIEPIKLFHKIQYLFFFLILCSPGIVSSQVNLEWSARYNLSGDRDDYPVGVKTDAAGNVYVAGSSEISTNSYDISVIKYSAAGTQLWTANYNGTGNANDEAEAMTIDNAGNVYVTGLSYTNNTTGQDFIILKYNTSGVLQWTARYDHNNTSDLGLSITVDNSGNIFAAGASSITVSDYDYVTLKYNSSGIMIWSAVYGTTGGRYDYPAKIVLDNSGNVCVTGQTRIYNNSESSNYLTIKYNPGGVQQWTAVYNGPSDSSDSPVSIVIDSAGSVYIGGQSKGIGSDADYAIVKYNPAGVQQWAARYNGTGNSYDACNALAIDNSGNIYAAGESFNGAGIFGCVTLKYNSAGVLQWIKNYVTPGGHFNGASALGVDNSGNVYVCGYTEPDPSQTDFLTIKYNSSGVQQWLMSFDGGTNHDDYIFNITLDGQNNVIVTGISEGSATGDDIATLKYSQLVGINPVAGEIPSQFKLFQNYPNPFNPTTNIKFDIPKAGNVKIAVYDVLGRQVQILVNEFEDAGSYEINFDASSLSSGIYFYKINAGEFNDVKKMILIK